MDRRAFIITALGGWHASGQWRARRIMTVDGPIRIQQMGTALVHEHFLVDFIGADKTGTHRWNRETVIQKVLPYLVAAKQAGVKTIFDCTPAFLGRDVLLLRQLSAASGMQIVTNTGYYGAVNNKYLPAWAFEASARQLADRWIEEAEHGIGGSRVRPGFIKISVDNKEPLSPLHRKLVEAAARTHRKTGLTIFSHTGPAPAAFEQLDILQAQGVDPSAFVWVHAQSEKDVSTYAHAARGGAWISLDGMGWGKWDEYAEKIVFLKEQGLLHRLLISHDAGWYKPDEPDAPFQGFTAIFTELFPRLRLLGFSDADLELLLIQNPQSAMQIKIRKATRRR